MTSADYLAAAQRRLWRLITHPEGVRTGLASEQGEAPLSELVKSDSQLCAEDRLDVYANAYFYRILDVLRDDYPALALALGETAFHDLATSYLAIHPSEHPSLRFIGARLATFVRDGKATEATRERAPWAADLAEFEWAKGEAFDARDAPQALRADLEGTAPEHFERLELRLVPAVRLLTLEWPVDRLREGSKDPEADVAALARSRTRFCIWRSDERTLHRRVGALEHQALTCLPEGFRFGALCQLAADESGDADAPALAAAWLGRWIDDGLLLSFSGQIRSAQAPSG